jgi:hypothetical protein
MVRLGLLMHRHDPPYRPLGALTPFAELVTRLAQTEGVQVYAMDPDDVDPDDETIDALQFTEAGWRECREPLPDVFWNRYFKRDEGHVVQGLRRRGVRPINEGVLDKWQAYRCLKEDPGSLRSCLPETARLSGAEVALEMLQRHPVIFIKPAGGSVGRGIMRGTAAAAGLLHLQYISTETDGPREVLVKPEQLDRWIARRERAYRYIVQQGLDLAVMDGQPADLRVLVQKDHSGGWSVTGMGARVGARGRFTTNLHTGGQGIPVERLFQSLLPGAVTEQQALLTQLERLALEAALQVERQVGSMGEIGFDFGIDRSSKIWYIEQNAQPGRAIFTHLGRQDLFELAHLRPILYAKYLTQGGRVKRLSAEST